MRILVLDNVDKSAVKILEDKFEVDVKNNLSTQDLEEIIPNYDAVVVRSQTKVTKDIIEKGINLKIIARAGVGLDNIDVNAAKEKNIKVINSPSGNTISAAEHTLGLIFSISRNISFADKSMKEGKWERSKFIGNELNKKTLGIIGFGKIGSHLAKICKAIGMNILAYDPYIKTLNDEQIKLVSFDDVIKNSDFISLHLPLTTETKNLINLDTMKNMKNSAVIINCSRGGIVNEDDLYIALNENIIKAAALDVFENEPLKDSKLIELGNKILLTPHLGASTYEAQINVAIDVANQIIELSKEFYV
jgi:D-3-phosphoglycerate dehydrogenase